MKYYPMLASQGSLNDLSRDELVFEPKLDGIRCVAHVDHSGALLYSRTGKNITAQFPDVEMALRSSMPLVLDGEIIVRDVHGREGACDFQVLQTRIQRKEAVAETALEAPAEFIAFDCLQVGYIPIIDKPWWHRRENLDFLCQKAGIQTSLCMDSVTASLRWQSLIENGCEGVMAKGRQSLYVPGTRSKSWLKIKPMLEGEFVIGGITWGYGRRKELFGGLVLGEYQRDLRTLQPEPLITFVGVVGSGLTDALMYDLLYSKLQARKQPTFYNWAAIDDVKHWVEPDFVAQVKFQEWTNDKKLRFPTLISVDRKAE